MIFVEKVFLNLYAVITEKKKLITCYFSHNACKKKTTGYHDKTRQRKITNSVLKLSSIIYLIILINHKNLIFFGNIFDNLTFAYLIFRCLI